MKHTFFFSLNIITCIFLTRATINMLLHYVVSLVAAPSFATEGRSLPSFQAIAHPSVLSSVGVYFFLCFHQTVSNRQRNVLGNSLICALIGRRSRRPLLTVDHINLNPPAERQIPPRHPPGTPPLSWPSVSDRNRFQSLTGCFHIFIPLLCLSYVHYWPLIWGLTSSIDSWEVCFLIVVTSPQSSLCRKSYKTNTDLFTSGPAAAAGAIPPSLPTHHDWIMPLKFPWQPSRKDLMENGHHNLVHLNLRSHIKTQWGSYCEAFSSGEVNETRSVGWGFLSFVRSFLRTPLCSSSASIWVWSVGTLEGVREAARGKW